MTAAADMNIENTVEQLNKARVLEWEHLIAEMLQANMPTVDVRKGSVFYDLVVRPNAIMAELMNKNINRFRRASSLKAITESPELVDLSMVDAVLSNYGITRKAGQTSTGVVTIYLSTNNTTSIPAGSTLTSGSLSFVVDSSFIGVPDADMVSKETDKLIEDVGNGMYAFQISVTAATTGAEYQLAQGTQLSLDSPPTNYIAAEAAYDFTDGAAEESNLALLARLETGISGKTLSSRKHIRALIEDSFMNVTHGAVIGMGDPEMQRDRDNIFQQSFGGKADIYLQTASRPLTQTLRKTATLVDPVAGKWQAFFDRDEFAGAYKILSVKAPGSQAIGSYEITSDVRGLSLMSSVNQEEFVPDVQSYMQAAFSRYQTAAIEFIDTDYDSSADAAFTTTKSYDMTLLGMPDVATIQDTLVSDYWASSFRYDDIVRAPIPCLVAVSVTIRVPAGTLYDKPTIRNEVAARINNAGFSDSLSTALIADAVHSKLSSTASVVMPIDLFGELIDPGDGTPRVFRTGNMLQLPTEYEKSMSKRTMMFFCDPTDVNVTVETA